MARLVSQHKSLTELYHQLLSDQREIDRGNENGTAICEHCKNKKSQHLPDDRCNVYATSRHFYSVDATRLEKIKQAIQLIETLTEIEI